VCSRARVWVHCAQHWCPPTSWLRRCACTYVCECIVFSTGAWGGASPKDSCGRMRSVGTVYVLRARVCVWHCAHASVCDTVRARLYVLCDVCVRVCLCVTLCARVSLWHRSRASVRPVWCVWALVSVCDTVRARLYVLCDVCACVGSTLCCEQEWAPLVMAAAGAWGERSAVPVHTPACGAPARRPATCSRGAGNAEGTVGGWCGHLGGNARAFAAPCGGAQGMVGASAELVDWWPAAPGAQRGATLGNPLGMGHVTRGCVCTCGGARGIITGSAWRTAQVDWETDSAYRVCRMFLWSHVCTCRGVDQSAWSAWRTSW